MIGTYVIEQLYVLKYIQTEASSDKQKKYNKGVLTHQDVI